MLFILLNDDDIVISKADKVSQIMLQNEIVYFDKAHDLLQPGLYVKL